MPLHRKGKLGGLQTNLGKLRAYCSLTCYLMPAIYTKLSHTHPNSQFSPWASLKTYVERKINTQSLLNLYQMWFYSTDKHFSTAALVEHHMAKTGVCFSRLFFFPFLNLIKNEIGPKNIERNKFKFTKNCTLSKSH